MKNQIINSLAARLYDQPVMDNRERGNYAEELVLQALHATDLEWKSVSVGWHPGIFKKAPVQAESEFS